VALPQAAVPVTFDEFYREERPALLRLAHLLVGSVVVGEELVQEAMLTTHRRWSDLDNPAGFVRRVLVNRARSHHRRLALERRHGRHDSPAPALPPELDETWTAIRRLRADDRAVLVLRFYEDLTIEQIAEVLDRPAGSIKSHLHRALARLKETLA
jgi:RNA polymerase sigma factor (sigma-70 family)